MCLKFYLRLIIRYSTKVNLEKMSFSIFFYSAWGRLQIVLAEWKANFFVILKIYIKWLIYFYFAYFEKQNVFFPKRKEADEIDVLLKDHWWAKYFVQRSWNSWMFCPEITKELDILSRITEELDCLIRDHGGDGCFVQRSWMR